MVKRKSGAEERPAKKVHSLQELSEEDFSSVDSDFQNSGSDVESSPDPESQPEELEEEVPERPSNGTHPAKHTLSGAEVRIARETSELFKTNVFKLQIDETLAEIKLDDRMCSLANKQLFALKEVISQAKSIGPLSAEAASKKFPTRIPFHGSKHVKYQLAFAPPVEVNVIGSYSLKTVVKQPESSGIDLLLTMPSDLFEQKDYLNYRYFHKRAFYLAAVAKAIASSKLDLRVSYRYLNGNVLKPVVRADFTDRKLSKHLHIMIHLGVEEELFPTRKLAADRNCVRDTEGPTPIYNSAILADVYHSQILRLLHTASTYSAAFTDACKLGRLWLRQRGYSADPAFGGFGHLQFALLMAGLLSGGPAGKRVLLQGYSSYQLFKGTVLFLADKELALNVSSHTTSSSLPGLWVNDLNVLADAPEWLYGLLQHDAKVTAELLSDVTCDRFTDLFLRRSDESQLRFDISFDVTFPLTEFDTAERAVSPSVIGFATQQIYSTLNQAWGDRIKHFAVFSSPQSEWSLSTPAPDVPDTVILSVRALLDVEHSDKRVTMGPDASEKSECKAFREFWGPISNLRRFQDGTIKEAVAWKVEEVNIPVVLIVARYILDYKFGVSLISVPSITRLLPTINEARNALPSLALYQAKIQAFNECSLMLQDLSDLPLRISSVFGTSASLRYTSLQEPVPYDLRGDDSIATAVMVCETSRKWPSKLGALEKTKTAFLINVAETIRELKPKYHPVVGVEPIPGYESEERGFLIVQTPQGYFFKFGIITARDLDIAAASNLPENALLAMKRHGQAGADHHRLIVTMALRYPLYSTAARLMKLWCKKHMLASHFTEQMIELLALKPFLDSAPYSPPSSAQTAFVRTLDFLQHWNWKEDPLIYDVERSESLQVEGVRMDPAFHHKLTANFTKQRQQDPAFTLSPLFIATKVDQTGILWTQSLPRNTTGILLAARLTGLARAARKLTSASLGSAFKTSTSEYDVVLNLRNPSASSSAGYKNLQVSDASKLAKSGNNVGLEFFNDIKETYGSSIVLFYSGSLDDKLNKNQVIAGIWNRTATEPHKFRVGLPYPVTPTSDGKVILDKSALLSEIKRMGGDLFH
ncbi:U3 small nucleolar RNA-associated protein 22 [Wickerhamiella sorbophila]|uniref:U3 small nucleolar RNA-associated protein 22 n=1 Tax=Wickerhamiella sorbophila TaxID=45607 RepID=A0A2T0FHA4_9ASCO|nr:U3 small nucleolar RNA-associated protein 22 [Wickerhamiella sorbophila]PRT54383.1 U3 small nucleolar RNA-associated protein 22 [Wickerhamiella sorbophila]